MTIGVIGGPGCRDAPLMVHEDKIGVLVVDRCFDIFHGLLTAAFYSRGFWPRSGHVMMELMFLADMRPISEQMCLVRFTFVQDSAEMRALWWWPRRQDECLSQHLSRWLFCWHPVTSTSHWYWSGHDWVIQFYTYIALKKMAGRLLSLLGKVTFSGAMINFSTVSHKNISYFEG